MPTYEYVCEKCGHEFEAFHSISAEPLKTCPKKSCKGRVKKKVSAGAGLLFKGSGFYITDYRSEGYKQAAKKDATPASPAGESKPAKAEAKTAPVQKATKPAKK